MVGGYGEGGGGDSELRVTRLNIFIPVEFLYCESRRMGVKRHFIYDERAKPVM